MNNNRLIVSFVGDFVKKLSPEAVLAILPVKNETLQIEIKSEDANALIGPGGETLFEIQYLLKTIIKRKAEGIAYVDLDINDYKKKKTRYLKELAVLTANEVSLAKSKKILAPMAAYERRIIHMELAGREDIATESVGEGLSRKVVIRPRI